MAVIILAAVSLLALSAWPFDDSRSRATLRGITAVKVVVDLDDNIEVVGPTWADQIQADVEARLRKAGLMVTLSAPAWLHIGIATHQISPDRSGYAHTIQTSFLQSVSLMRDSRVTTLAATWSIESVGWIPGLDSATLQYFEDSVARQVDTFINVYFEQNAKR
jgi:hypothetical protein